MAGRGGPLSPMSAEGSEWSGISKYQLARHMDSPYAAAAPQQRGGPLPHPPMLNGFNPAYTDGPSTAAMGRRPGDIPGNPSPPNSIARSSEGNGLSPAEEESLQDHYLALSRFLSNFLRDEKGNPRSNRAKDKLLRLSAVQFHELSTDVFDELLRRQSASGARRSGPGGSVQEGAPPFLVPEDNFHPKRNQARQKLSTLPTLRFRDLATDVFFELERRFPRFTSSGGENERDPSPISGNRGGNGRNLMPAPPKGALIPGSRGLDPRLSDAYSPVGPYNENLSSFGQGNEYGRPLPKTFQSNTMIPNKSTMVEDDDDTITPEETSGHSDPYRLVKRASKRPIDRGVNGLDADPKLAAENQAQVREMQGRISELEGLLREQDDELSRLQLSGKHQQDAADMERQEWSGLRLDLENKLKEARTINESMHVELEKLRAVNGGLERDLRVQQQQESSVIKGDDSGLKREYEDLEKRHEELKLDLHEQQQVTEEVRREASKFLEEMKSLSDQCSQSWEKEEALVGRVTQLEKEVDEWKTRYARTKSQVRNLRASFTGTSIRSVDAGAHAKDSRFISPNGRVKDVHVTKFQIAIDELLRVARLDDPSSVLNCMKAVIFCTRHITQDISGVLPDGEDSAAKAIKLKSRVSSYANNLITVVKMFASSDGLSPVSLLDAAASHLTTAIVELIDLVKVRPTPDGELDDEEVSLPQGASSDFSPIHNGRLSGESVYSSLALPTRQPSDRLNGDGIDHWASTRQAQAEDISHEDRRRDVMSFEYDAREQEIDVEELKIYLEEQVEELGQAIQALVSSIRANAGMSLIRDYISDIAGIVANIVSWTRTGIEEARNPSLQAALRERGEPVISKLSDCRALLLNANVEGERISDPALLREFTNKLPPLAFEIARETRSLVQRIDLVKHNMDERENDRFR